MVLISFIAADGSEQTIDAREGLSLMENAIANGIDGIEAICGGNAYCGTCRVHVDPDWRSVTGDATEVELPMLEVSEDESSGARLSCQLRVTKAFDGLVVRIPASQC